MMWKLCKITALGFVVATLVVIFAIPLMCFGVGLIAYTEWTDDDSVLDWINGLWSRMKPS